MLDIYATSIDYDAHTDASRQFFATVQNKMHWAAHGHIAAELIALRADPAQPNMGLTNWTGAAKGGAIHKADVGVAKNYLNTTELDSLNRIVNAYIEVAELQAQARQPMTMRDWAMRLDDFLRMTARDVLAHAGKVSAEVAQAQAEAAYSLFRQQSDTLLSRVEQDFEAAIAQPVKQMASGRKIAGSSKKRKDA